MSPLQRVIRFPQAALLCRAIATSAYRYRENDHSHEPVRQVFISQSSDIFTNLALEDWLYRNHDFGHMNLLLLWRNDPCVVIGRNQNPWTECNLPYTRENGVQLARRHTGGGTVYHDQGNINCTFFSKKRDYQPIHNLDIICAAIQRLTTLQVTVNEREDIILNNTHKISDTASKLGKENAYHHCTILVDVNKSELHAALVSQAKGIESRATQSVRVPVKNIHEVDTSVSIDRLQDAVGNEFLRTTRYGQDGGREEISHQHGYHLVRPDDAWFPGLGKIRKELISDAWLYKQTPKFTIKATFLVPPDLASSDNVPDIRIELEIDRGLVQGLCLQPAEVLEESHLDLSGLVKNLELNSNLPGKMLKAFKDNNIAPSKAVFLRDCISSMIEKWV